MGADQALELLNRLIWSAALISGPLLAATLIVGLVISVLQVATQLQEATLSYVPKLIAAALILVAAGPWMLHTLMNFSTYVLKLIPTLG
jgi:flagellar biosynthetic protein FliQ